MYTARLWPVHRIAMKQPSMSRGTSSRIVGSFVALTALTMAGCDGNSPIVGSGTLITQTRKLSTFGAVEVQIIRPFLGFYCPYRVRVINHVGPQAGQSIAQSSLVKIMADDNIASLISSTVIDGRLVLSVSQHIRPANDIQVDVGTVMSVSSKGCTETKMSTGS